MDSWALATVAFLLLVFAAVSGRLERSLVTVAIFFTSAGLLAGPVLGLLDLELGSEPVKLLAEATLTLVLFADASRVNLPALRREVGVPVRLLGVGLPLTIVAGTLAGVAVLPGMSLSEALVLGVMLACTDAALGQAVVTDRRIPSRIRQGLNVESGLNDGLCVPLFFIAIAIAEAEEGALSGRRRPRARRRGDRLWVGRRHRGRRARRSGRERGAAARARRAALAPDPHGGDRGPGRGHRDRPRRQHLHRGLRRRPRVRRRAAPGRGRGRLPRRPGRGTSERGHVPGLRRRHPRPEPGRADLGARALRRAQPDRRSHAPGRALGARHGRPADRRSPSSAGSARAGSRRSSSRSSSSRSPLSPTRTRSCSPSWRRSRSRSTRTASPRSR